MVDKTNGHSVFFSFQLQLESDTNGLIGIRGFMVYWLERTMEGLLYFTLCSASDLLSDSG